MKYASKDFIILSILCWSCTAPLTEEIINQSRWVSIVLYHHELVYENGVILVGKKEDWGICKYKMEHVSGERYRLYGWNAFHHLDEHGRLKEAARDTVVYDFLGDIEIEYFKDSIIMMNNFTSCSDVDTGLHKVKFMNVNYYAKKVKWDSVQVTNYGGVKHFKRTYIKDELTPSEQEMVAGELAILLYSGIQVYDKYRGMGLSHTIKIYQGDSLIYDEDCTTPLQNIMPNIILNKVSQDR